MIRFLILFLILITNNCFSQDTIAKDANEIVCRFLPAPFKITNCDTVRIKDIEGSAFLLLRISDKAIVNSFNIDFLNVVNNNNNKRIKYDSRTSDKLLFDEYPKNVRPYYGLLKKIVDSLVIEKNQNAKHDSINHMYVRVIISPIEDKTEEELTKKGHKCY